MPSGFRGIDPPLTPQPGVPRGAPTLTPTLTPTLSPDTTNGPSIRSDTVYVISAGDIATLEDAIDESNFAPTVLYEIYLLAGEYQLSATLVVSGNLKIYGAHVDTTILRQVGLPGSQTGSMNTMIKVAGSATLSIDNLTLTEGRSNGLAGAVKIETHSGMLIATNIKFIGNSAADDGGAIYSIGSVSLYKVEFRDNVAKRGGAIFHELNPNPVGIDAKYVDFKGNQATNPFSGGGAVQVKTGSHKFRQSNFRNNINNDAPTSISRHVRWSGGDIVNAKKNYWNAPTVPSSANIQGVNTLNQLSAKVNFEFDPPAVAPPCSARGRQLCSPTPTPTVQFATVTPTPTPAPSTWYVTCHNLTGPLSVKNAPDGTTFGYADPGSQVIRPNLTEWLVDDRYVRVEIYWPPGETSQTGFVSIRDTAVPADGDYLTQTRDPACPDASPTPTASPLPTATATFDPSIPLRSPGRFGEGVGQIRSVFGPFPPAKMGALPIHGVAQIDIVPAHTEECLDTNTNLADLYECDQFAPIAIYAPVDGCAWRVPYIGSNYLIVFIINCENPASYPDGRREFALTHLDQTSISHIPTTEGTPGPGGFAKGELIGYLCPNGTKEAVCNVVEDAGTHLAFSLRFYEYSNYTPATDEELYGFLASPWCMFDDWANQSPPFPLSSSPYEACPYP
ncbi:MAG: hypothetical protein H3C32_12400 [Anaerolineae bacterium]|nr:hypothetical protein [Anaerolineae bacterium]